MGRIDHVTGRGLADEGVQPGFVPADPPARLVADHPGRTADRLADLFVVRLTPLSRTGQAAGHRAAGKVNVEQPLEQRRTLAVREAQLFVQYRQGRVQVGTELDGGRPHRIAGLDRMPALNGVPASAAGASMDVPPMAVCACGCLIRIPNSYLLSNHACETKQPCCDLPVDRLARDLRLILGGHAGLGDLATAAVGTGLRQRCLIRLVDPDRGLTADVLTVVLAGLAAGLVGTLLRRFLAERRRLPPPRPLGLLQRRREFLHLRRQLRHALLKRRHLTPQPFAVRTTLSRRFRVHDGRTITIRLPEAKRNR